MHTHTRTPAAPVCAGDQGLARNAHRSGAGSHAGTPATTAGGGGGSSSDSPTSPTHRQSGHHHRSSGSSATPHSTPATGAGPRLERVGSLQRRRRLSSQGAQSPVVLRRSSSSGHRGEEEGDGEEESGPAPSPQQETAQRLLQQQQQQLAQRQKDGMQRSLSSAGSISRASSGTTAAFPLHKLLEQEGDAPQRPAGGGAAAGKARASIGGSRQASLAGDALGEENEQEGGTVAAAPRRGHNGAGPRLRRSSSGIDSPSTSDALDAACAQLPRLCRSSSAATRASGQAGSMAGRGLRRMSSSGGSVAGSLQTGMHAGGEQDAKAQQAGVATAAAAAAAVVALPGTSSSPRGTVESSRPSRLQVRPEALQSSKRRARLGPLYLFPG